MKKATFILVLVLAMLLTACGSNSTPTVPQESASIESSPVESVPVETIKPSDKLTVIDGNTITLWDDGTGTDDSGDGLKKTVALTNRQINYTIEAGSFTITINSVQLADMEFQSSDTASLFNMAAGDSAAIFSVDLTVENTSDDNLTFYPDQSTIVTNTKAQVVNDLLISDNVGGDFLGKVIKNGQIIFIIPNNAAADITTIKWHVDAPLDTNFDKMCDDIVVTFNFRK